MRVTPLLVGAALLLGLLWLREHAARTRQAEAARRSQDSLVTAVAADRAERAARYAADSANYEAARKRAASELAAARRVADESAGAYGRLLDSLAAMAPDTLSGFVSRLLTAWQAEQAGWLAERAAADAALAERDARIVALEATYAADLSAAHAQVAEALRQLTACNRRASPGLLRRAVAALPWVAGAYLIGRVAR